MCKIYAYCRVSTSDRSAKQDYERQKYLLEHSGMKFDKVFEEHISGGVKGNQREQFNAMLECLEPTDIVCFTETSRFGRNYIDCFEMLDLITQKKKATVKFLSNGITLDGGEKMNPYMWLTISNFFIQDEFLKRRKKEQGVVLGRPKTIPDDIREKVISLKGEMTYRQIAEETGVSLATVSRIMKEV